MLKLTIPGASCEPRSTAVVDEVDATRRRSVARFSGSVRQSAYYTFRVPDNIDLSAAPSIDIDWFSAGNAGNVEWEVEVEAITPGDATSLSGAESFDAVNAAAAAAVPGTIGQLVRTSVSLANRDNLAGGDHIRVIISRDGVNDSNNDVAYVSQFHLMDAAA